MPINERGAEPMRGKNVDVQRITANGWRLGKLQKDGGIALCREEKRHTINTIRLANDESFPT